MKPITKRAFSRTLPLLLLATTAAAQGEPPFGTGNRGESAQVAELFLAIDDTTDSGCCTLEIRSDDELRVVKIQDEGEAGSGSLLVAPEDAILVGPDFGVQLGVPPGNGTGNFWVIGGGTYYRDGSCTTNSDLSTYALIEYSGTDAASSFDTPAGTIDVYAEVRTSDYGVRYETPSSFWYHSLRSVAGGTLRDWVYVSGAGPTATLNVTAAIDALVDVPVSVPQSNADDFWTTQPYGDLRELANPEEPSGSDPYLRGPGVFQQTRFDVALAIKRWSLEPECVDTDEDGIDDYCEDVWLDEDEASASGTRQRSVVLEYEYPPFETPIPRLVPYATDTLGETLGAEAVVPTGIWLEVRADVTAESQCAGVLHCDLDARSGDPVALSITSPDGALVAWRGIAGLTRVPEPGAALSIATAFAALARLGARRRR